MEVKSKPRRHRRKGNGKNISQNYDLVSGGKYLDHHTRVLFICGEGNDTMTEIKNIIWNLAGAFIYFCVGFGAVFHTILGH
jgi:hypothetical protein